MKYCQTRLYEFIHCITFKQTLLSYWHDFSLWPDMNKLEYLFITLKTWNLKPRNTLQFNSSPQNNSNKMLWLPFVEKSTCRKLNLVKVSCCFNTQLMSTTKLTQHIGYILQRLKRNWVKENWFLWVEIFFRMIFIFESL